MPVLVIAADHDMVPAECADGRALWVLAHPLERLSVQRRYRELPRRREPTVLDGVPSPNPSTVSFRCMS
jgi:hypothetical protein